jgi:hypothetical protein
MKTLTRTPKEHLEWIGGSRWAWTTLVSVTVFFGSLAYAPSRGDLLPQPYNHTPLLESTPASAPNTIGKAILGTTIPDEPFPTQLTKCDSRFAQVEIKGGCWVKTETQPPCPEGYQWEWKKACWLPALRAARAPTTGDPEIPVGVSNPTTP